MEAIVINTLCGCNSDLTACGLGVPGREVGGREQVHSTRGGAGCAVVTSTAPTLNQCHTSIHEHSCA